MKTEVLLLIVVGFFVADTIYDGKYTKSLTKYKKHFRVTMIIFVAFSLYLFMKKNPNESHNMVNHLHGAIKYMPLDKHSKDFITPILAMNRKNNFIPPQQKRMLNSGGGKNGSTRSVSGTKKKYIAAAQEWKCNDCGEQLDAWYEVDHKVRLADGGSNHVSNLVALCRNCHGKKTTMESM